MTPELHPCGTYGAYQRHLRRKQAPCVPCYEAAAEYFRKYRERRPTQPRRALKPCGTIAAYSRHLRRKEMPCAECKAAYKAYYFAYKHGEGDA
jgi:hypothetical protein